MRRNYLFLPLFFFCAATTFAQKKAVMLWFDAHANFQRLSSPDSIRHYMQKAKSVGVTDVVIDVKPITGDVLYQSQYAPYLKNWKGYEWPKQFDYLNTCIEEGHKEGLIVYAAINVFCGGHNFFNKGLIYTGHPEWQSINYTDSGFVPISKIKTKYSGMLNPANPEVQKYQLNILEELIRKHPKLDGIVLDRVRYDGMEADFSDLSRKLFEKYIGKKVTNFPQDIFSYKKEGKKSVKVPGPLYNQWVEWRASVIYNFFKDARKVAKKANPKIIFADYTGAWYPTYFEVGVNWASKKYDPSQEYQWATKKYRNYGYAELLDVYTTGCYFFEVTRKEVEEANKIRAARTEAGMNEEKAPWYSVEGSAELAMNVTKGVVPVYGGLYVEQYEKDKKQFTEAMKMCLKKTEGLMIFDLVHICEKGWWDTIKDATSNN